MHRHGLEIFIKIQYVVGRRMVIPYIILCPGRLMVRAGGFQPPNSGSIPGWGTTKHSPWSLWGTTYIRSKANPIIGGSTNGEAEVLGNSR